MLKFLLLLFVVLFGAKVVVHIASNREFPRKIMQRKLYVPTPSITVLAVLTFILYASFLLFS